MKYLNDDITLTFSNLPNTSTDLNFTYILKQNGTAIFTGAAFKQKAQTSLTVNVTELLQSMHYKNDCMEKPLTSINSSIASGVVDIINASLFINSSSYSSDSQHVAFAYQYPHYVTDICKCPIYNKNQGGTAVILNNMLLGLNSSFEQTVLTPEIPYINTTEYGFGTVYQKFNGTTPTINFNEKLYGSISLNAATNTNIYYGSLATIFGAATLMDQEDLLDLTTFISGQYATGNAQWINPLKGVVKMETNLDPSVAICDSNNNSIALSQSLTTLTVGQMTTFSFTFSSDHHIEYIRIGTLDDCLMIMLDLSSPYGLIILNDTLPRTFTVQLNIMRQDPLQYYIDKIVILNDSYYYTSYGTLNLGTHVLANIQTCPADWYLEWIDRYGSFQSQPFYQKTTYSETFEYLEIQNYNGERRKTYFNTQGKFQINSGWLKDTVYPIYESIYTSPYLLLYDVKNDKSYNVICSDKSYEEKKFLNGRQIINMQLNLEINKSQSKIY